eukprot:jgi/Psemu1/59786/gm1.59786_g
MPSCPLKLVAPMLPTAMPSYPLKLVAPPTTIPTPTRTKPTEPLLDRANRAPRHHIA